MHSFSSKKCKHVLNRKKCSDVSHNFVWRHSATRTELGIAFHRSSLMPLGSIQILRVTSRVHSEAKKCGNGLKQDISKVIYRLANNLAVRFFLCQISSRIYRLLSVLPLDNHLMPMLLLQRMRQERKSNAPKKSRIVELPRSNSRHRLKQWQQQHLLRLKRNVKLSVNLNVKRNESVKKEQPPKPKRQPLCKSSCKPSRMSRTIHLLS
mmetsp:Transcript_31232/g.51566  ORF Transcript_31232/g.51566 Transcript_31232/m.51566 type:complete len:208 (-) Transcript_31232:885-1508(-)